MVRLKNRYLLAEVVWKDGKLDETFTDSSLLQALRESVAHNFGDHGIGSNLGGLQVKYYSPYSTVAVVRCATAEHERVVTCMALLTELKQRAAAVRVLRVSGTLARCKEAAVAHSAFKLQQAKLGKQQRASADQLHAALPALEL